ncbi:hypothetical protein SAMN04489712_104344 [Thermomonospora echinospora]|uniref:Uncharacterized protein n=1 Tax=Thermomonospora echinospora TaxID=1992 RepID=A0A1H5Z4C6_9ACTN|nr:hypothetical protein [Thermomonospora echinospora]SEG31191.1 hypothetical protein SAMN04489712_104344 [Thermomonospora echinospora]
MTEAKRHLEELGTALTEAGFKVRVVVGDPPVLHVAGVGTAELAEQIGCRVNPLDGQLWFQWVALEVFLGRASDVPDVVERIKYIVHSQTSGGSD